MGAATGRGRGGLRSLGSVQARGQRGREALLEAQIALVVEAAAVDDERAVVARASHERRERGQRQARLGELRGGGAVVVADTQAGEPVADRREISRVAPPPWESSDASTTSAKARRAPRSSAGQPPASMAR